MFKTAPFMAWRFYGRDSQVYDFLYDFSLQRSEYMLKNSLIRFIAYHALLGINIVVEIPILPERNCVGNYTRTCDNDCC